MMKFGNVNVDRRNNMDSKDVYIDFLKWLNQKDIQLTEEEIQ